MLLKYVLDLWVQTSLQRFPVEHATCGSSDDYRDTCSWASDNKSPVVVKPSQKFSVFIKAHFILLQMFHKVVMSYPLWHQNQPWDKHLVLKNTRKTPHKVRLNKTFLYVARPAVFIHPVKHGMHALWIEVHPFWPGSLIYVKVILYKYNTDPRSKMSVV